MLTLPPYYFEATFLVVNDVDESGEPLTKPPGFRGMAFLKKALLLYSRHDGQLDIWDYFGAPNRRFNLFISFQQYCNNYYEPLSLARLLLDGPEGSSLQSSLKNTNLSHNHLDTRINGSYSLG